MMFDKMENREMNPDMIDIPLLPLRDVVVFPHMIVPLFVGRGKMKGPPENTQEREKKKT